MTMRMYRTLMAAAVKTRRRTGLGVGLAVAVGMLLLAGCGDDSDDSADTTEAPVTTEAAETVTVVPTTTTSPTDDDSTFNETARDRFGVAGGAVMESEFTTGDDLTSEETARAICEGEDVFLLLVPGADEADSQGFFDFAMEEFCPSERE